MRHVGILTMTCYSVFDDCSASVIVSLSNVNGFSCELQLCCMSMHDDVVVCVRLCLPNKDLLLCQLCTICTYAAGHLGLLRQASQKTIGPTKKDEMNPPDLKTSLRCGLIIFL